MATIKTMSRLGPVKLTLAEVAREAGLSAATLVQRFGSKRALLLAVSQDAAAGMDDCFDDFRQRHASPLEALIAAATDMARQTRTPDEMANTLAFLQIDVSDPDFRRPMIEMSRKILKGYERLIEAGHRRRRAPAVRPGRPRARHRCGQRRFAYFVGHFPQGDGRGVGARRSRRVDRSLPPGEGGQAVAAKAGSKARLVTGRSLVALVLAVAALGAAATARGRSQASSSVADAEARAVAFLSREVPLWRREHPCYSCHNNGDAARALIAAAERGHRTRERARRHARVAVAAAALGYEQTRRRIRGPCAGPHPVRGRRDGRHARGNDAGDGARGRCGDRRPRSGRGRRAGGSTCRRASDRRQRMARRWPPGRRDAPSWRRRGRATPDTLLARTAG